MYSISRGGWLALSTHLVNVRRGFDCCPPARGLTTNLPRIRPPRVLHTTRVSHALAADFAKKGRFCCELNHSARVLFMNEHDGTPFSTDRACVSALLQWSMQFLALCRPNARGGRRRCGLFCPPRAKAIEGGVRVCVATRQRQPFFSIHIFEIDDQKPRE